VALNPDFKVTAILDAEYITNFARQTYLGPQCITSKTLHTSYSSVWTTLSDLGKFSTTRNVARPFCDSWASCISRDPISSQSNVRAVHTHTHTIAIENSAAGTCSARHVTADLNGRRGLWDWRLCDVTVISLLIDEGKLFGYRQTLNFESLDHRSNVLCETNRSAAGTLRHDDVRLSAHLFVRLSPAVLF